MLFSLRSQQDDVICCITDPIQVRILGAVCYPSWFNWHGIATWFCSCCLNLDSYLLDADALRGKNEYKINITLSSEIISKHL